MSKTKFSSPSDYLNSVSENSNLAFVQVSLAAEFLRVTPAMVSDLVRSKSLDAVIVTGKTKNWKGILVSSLISYTTSRDEGATSTINKIRTILEEYALKRKKIAYSDLMGRVDMSSTNPHHRRLIGEYLGKISEGSYSTEKFLLSALAVLKSTGMPNESFFILAKDLGAMREKDEEKIFYDSQLKKIFKTYSGA